MGSGPDRHYRQRVPHANRYAIDVGKPVQPNLAFAALSYTPLQLSLTVETARVFMVAS